MPEAETDPIHPIPARRADRKPVSPELQAEIDQALKDLTESIEPAWQRGDLTPEKIAKAIAEYRAEHPYRSP